MSSSKTKEGTDGGFGRHHPKRRSRWGKRARFVCHCCRKEMPFCWNCPCGFQICDSCFKENMWGLSNGATWVCPDCGRVRSF